MCPNQSNYSHFILVMLFLMYNKKISSRFNLKLFFLFFFISVVYNSVTLYIQFQLLYLFILWYAEDTIFYIIFLSFALKQQKKRLQRHFTFNFHFFFMLLLNFLSSQWGSKWREKCWEQIIWLHEFTLAWISIKEKK
jgi:hypothetical protein